MSGKTLGVVLFIVGVFILHAYQTLLFLWNLVGLPASDVVDDTTPQLGGNLDVNGKTILSVSNGDIAITPNGTGDVILDGLKWPQADGTADYVLKTNGAGQLSWVAEDAGGISNVVDDTTPQLGGSLDVNGQSLVSVSNGDIPITPNGTGDIILDGLKWPQADGTADYVLKTNGSGQLSLALAVCLILWMISHLSWVEIWT